MLPRRLLSCLIFCCRLSLAPWGNGVYTFHFWTRQPILARSDKHRGAPEITKVLQIGWKTQLGKLQSLCWSWSISPGWSITVFPRLCFPIKKKLLLEAILSLVVCYIQRGSALKDLDSSAVIPRLLATVCYCMSICIWTLGGIRKKVIKVNRNRGMVLITAAGKGSVCTKCAGGLFFTCWKSPLYLDCVSLGLSVTTKITH